MSETVHANYRTDTFTATLSGFSAAQTGEVSYYRDGSTIHLSWPAFSGTSNAITMTLTGMPATITPTAAARDVVQVTEAGATAAGMAELVAGSPVVTFRATAVGAAFTATGTKGLSAHVMSYTSVPH